MLADLRARDTRRQAAVAEVSGGLQTSRQVGAELSAYLFELMHIRVGRHVGVARPDRLVDCARARERASARGRRDPSQLYAAARQGPSRVDRAEEGNILKMTLAYSFQAPSASTSLPSPLGTRRNGPISMRPPSNDEHPGPPLNLCAHVVDVSLWSLEQAQRGRGRTRGGCVPCRQCACCAP